jgi:hypothetical protein
MGSSCSRVQFVSFSNFNNVLCNFDFVGGRKLENGIDAMDALDLHPPYHTWWTEVVNYC